MSAERTDGPQEIDWGTFEIRQDPPGLIGTMWVRPLGGGALDNYFVMLSSVAFPIPIPPGEPLEFVANDEMGQFETPEQFYMASMKYLGTDKVSAYRTLEIPVAWEPG